MDNAASFRFYGSLNDFLAKGQKGKLLEYAFNGAPAIKDAVEALGVPHPEVYMILVNGQPVVFQEKLRPGDEVAVYGAENRAAFPAHDKLQGGEQVPNRFVLDVHLGKLVRHLRLLGFDCRYRNDYSDQDIADIAATENRIVLTRDIGLLKHKSIRWGYWLRSQHPGEQLLEVLGYFQLQPSLAPFTRCMACNGNIQAVEKQQVLAQLPPKTRQYFNEFYQCDCCQRVYWKGSHYERMLDFVQQLVNE